MGTRLCISAYVSLRRLISVFVVGSSTFWLQYILSIRACGEGFRKKDLLFELQRWIFICGDLIRFVVCSAIVYLEVSNSLVLLGKYNVQVSEKNLRLGLEKRSTFLRVC